MIELIFFSRQLPRNAARSGSCKTSLADRCDSLGQLRLELTRILERAKPLDFSDSGGDVPRDPPPLGRAPSQRRQRLLALNGVLDDVRGEAVKAKPDVDVVADPDGRPGHRRRREVAEPAVGLGARLADPREDGADLAGDDVRDDSGMQ